MEDGRYVAIKKEGPLRLIIEYADKRAKKDEHNRQKGLRRLEKKLQSGKLTKSHINNRGYNKYLKLIGELSVQIDYEKFEQDQKWDGLKGYITNAKLSPAKVIENYKQLWQIERAFRVSKTDLQIRPIYHRVKDRIEAHLCIAFTAYAVYKELQRTLHKQKCAISSKRAAELTRNMYELNVILPDKKVPRRFLLQMDEEQKKPYQIIQKN